MRKSEALNVKTIARLCGVHRATVHGWIKKGRLPAHPMPGGGHRMTVAELVRFMQSEGMPIPSELDAAGETAPANDVNCWTFWERAAGNRHDCEKCLAYQTKAKYCHLVARRLKSTQCPGGRCEDCDYYLAVISPDLGMVDRLHQPAIAHRNGRVVRVNDAWASLHGWRANECLGRPLTEFVHPTNPRGDVYPGDADRRGPAQSNGHVVSEFVGRMKNGAAIPLRAATSSMSAPVQAVLVLVEPRA